MATSVLDPRMVDPNFSLQVLNLNTTTLSTVSAVSLNLVTTFLSAVNVEVLAISTNNITVSSLEVTNINSTNNNAIDITSTNLQIQNLTATNNIVTDFIILTANSDITFTDDYKSKVVHFDTTTTPQITAFFPTSLTNGFNVSLVNAGIGIIYLSSDGNINAQGLVAPVPYTGVFVYKVDNELFGIGALE